MALFPALLLIIHMASSSCRTISIESLEGRLESSDPDENLADLFLPLLEQSSEPKSIQTIELSEYNGKRDSKKKRLKKFEQYGTKHLVEIAPLKTKHRNKKTPLAIIVTAPGISKKRNWKNRNREYKEYTGSNFSLEDFFRKTPDSTSGESAEQSNEVSEESEGSHLKSEKSSEEQVLNNAYYNSGHESVEERRHNQKTEHMDSSDSEKSKDTSELDSEKTNDTLERENKKSRRRISSESKRSKESDDESDKDINSAVKTENLVKKEVTSEIISEEKISKETESQSDSDSEKNSEDDEIENKEKHSIENETQETGTHKDKISENSSEHSTRKESDESDADTSTNESINIKHKTKILEKSNSNSDSDSSDDKENLLKDENKHSNTKIESIQVSHAYESAEKILQGGQEQIKEANEHDSNEDRHKNPKKTIHNFSKTSEEHNAEGISNKNGDVSTDNIEKHHTINNKDADDVSNVDKSINNHHSQKGKSDLYVKNSSTDESSDDTLEEKLDGIIKESEVSTDDYSIYKERLAVPKDKSAERFIEHADKTPSENLSDDYLKPKIYEIENFDDEIVESKLVEVKDSISDIESGQDSLTLENKDLSYLGYEPLSDSNSERTEHNIEKNGNNRIGDWTFEVHSSDESKTEFKIDDSESTDEENCDDENNKPDITVKESVQTVVEPKICTRLKANKNYDGYDEERILTNSKADKNKASDVEKNSVSYNTNKSYKLSFLFNKK